MKRSQSMLLLSAICAAGCSNPQAPQPSVVGVGSRSAALHAPSRSKSGACSLDGAAFCDTFDKPAPGGRGGDLDETLWSVARVGWIVNSSQGDVVAWPAATASACGKTTPGVLPSQDVFTCKNPSTGRAEITSVFKDGDGPAFQSFRVLQPFDFEGRVGRITLDVDAKTQTPEGHGWWWELVIADEPVPVPYQEFVSHSLMAHKAIVLEFEGISSFDGSTNELSHVFVEDGYKYAHEFTREQAKFVSFKTKDDVLNHIEILLGKDSLEVWATDLDDMSTFRKVASLDRLGLSFTRGYVNLQHSQYNAAKAGLDGFVTYHVGSLGFDGPALPRPRSYQVPDALTIGRGKDASVKNLGYELEDGVIATCCGDEKPVPSFTLEGVDLTDAAEARINLNAWYFEAARAIEFRFNGGAWRSFKHPYPESQSSTRAVSIPVALADLKQGQNTLALRAAGTSTQPPMIVANVELDVVPR